MRILQRPTGSVQLGDPWGRYLILVALTSEVGSSALGFVLSIDWGLSGLGFTIEEWLLSVFFGLIPLRPKCIMSVDGFGVSSCVAADSVEGRLLGAS